MRTHCRSRVLEIALSAETTGILQRAIDLRLQNAEPETVLPIMRPEPETVPPIMRPEPETVPPIMRPEPETVPPIMRPEPETVPPIVRPEPETVTRWPRISFLPSRATSFGPLFD
jgi:hypothetical protein